MRYSHPAYRIALIAALAVALPAFAPARAMIPTRAPVAQSAGPDSFGYRFIDSQDASGPSYSALFEDIASSGTQAHGNNVDDGVASVSLGFTFQYYGQDFTTVFIGSNGNLQFTTSGSTTFSNPATIPSTSAPNGLVMPFFDDLHTRTGTVRYSTLGTAPNRRFIAHWVNVGVFTPTTGVTYNFQAKLYEDGRIYFLYNSMSGGVPSGSSASIGIENPAGTVGLTYHLNGVTPSGTTPSGSSTAIANQRAVLIVNNQAPFDPTGAFQANDSGGAPRPVGFVTDSTIYFGATVSDPDGSNTLGIEAEILPSTSPFSSTTTTGTLVRTPVASLVNDGQVAESLLDFSAAGLPSGSYHWRLRAFDNAGASSNWVVFDPATVHFTTDFAPPTIPSGPFSPDGVQLIFLAPTGDVPFSWGPSTDVGPPGPIGYRLEISLSSAFNATVYDAVLTAQDATVNLTAADTPYFWRVSAVDQAGNLSAPSTTAVFQLSWTTPFSEGEDRHANCGATTGGGSPLTLCLAVTAALLGLLLMRRPAA